MWFNMPVLTRKVHMIQEIMNSPYHEEKYDDFIKYYNDRFEILKQRGFYVIIDKRNYHKNNIYLNLDTAYKNIVKS
jgi:hypothetical protein